MARYVDFALLKVTHDYLQFKKIKAGIFKYLALYKPLIILS